MAASSKAVKGTNIVVKRSIPVLELQDPSERIISLIRSIDADDRQEVLWMRTLRPERNLIRPEEAFLQGIKTLRPAFRFNTFDVNKMNERRNQKRIRDQKIADERRRSRMAPTAAIKAVTNPKKLPSGSSATEEEKKFLLRDKEMKRKALKKKIDVAPKERKDMELETNDQNSKGRDRRKQLKKKIGHRI
jgi:hypothetical protein